MNDSETGSPAVLEVADLEVLLSVLHARGWTVAGPQRRDGAIVYDVLESAADLPAGWTDEQDAGHYRLVRRDDEARFGHRPGPTSWKRFLFPTDVPLWRAVRGEKGIEFRGPDPAPRWALLGVRACELHAIAIHDRVLLGGEHVDPIYRERRSAAFLIAVACGEAGGTCFCASMGTGPEPGPGWDLLLTELVEPGNHRLLIAAGSERGADVMKDLPCRRATADEIERARRVPERARAEQRRSMDTKGLAARLAASPDHPRWAEVAERCLACGNCTLACPTCFCHAVDDVLDLAGTGAARVRRWDSCFGLEFSYIHGGSVRPSVRARYRQWLTHKLSSWETQFGSLGCVGCGRCITWCPARIDLTEEVRALQSGRSRKGERHAHA